jgi:hypothetical protein
VFPVFSKGYLRRHTGDKLQADRALSHLPKKEWPRALDKLGANKSDGFTSCNKNKPHTTFSITAFINDVDADEIYYRSDNHIDEGGGVCTFASNDAAYMVLRNAAIAGGNDAVSFVGSAGISTIYIQWLYGSFWVDDAACLSSPMNYPPG